jgi:hypothetical protein
MFRTSKCSSSGRLVHAVLWYFFCASIYTIWSMTLDTGGCYCWPWLIYSLALIVLLHKRNTIKLHVQVFLRLNTWMFETCRRHFELRTGQSHWSAKRAAPVLYADCQLSISTTLLQLNLCNTTYIVQGLKLTSSDCTTASTKNLSYRLDCHTAPFQSATYIYTW